MDNSILRRAYDFVAAIFLMVFGVIFYFNPLAALLYLLPFLVLAALITALSNRLDTLRKEMAKLRARVEKIEKGGEV